MRSDIWSCGGGTQSGAIAALIGRGLLPKPDLCVMVDTGMEKSATWPFVDGFIRPQLRRAGCELKVIPTSDWATVDLVSLNGESILMPGFTNQSGTVGKLDPYCSNEWKTRPVRRYLRSIGVEKARCWLGFSLDEMRRVRTSDTQWLELFYPLIFTLPQRRYQCIEVIRSEGWTGLIPHSACYSCPNNSDPEWIDMQRNWPDDFAQACRLEERLQKIDPHFFLHPSCTPLAEVDFFAQSTMFPERGCTSGCFT
jgi:hypothetical protein